MAVTLAQLSVALRITTDPTATVPEPAAGILTRIQSWAESEISGRAPDAPDNYRDQALVLLAGYVYDRPPAERGLGIFQRLGEFRYIRRAPPMGKPSRIPTRYRPGGFPA